MNSFDVFDTLLARRNLTSDPIWHHIETEFSLVNYTVRRKEADTGSRNLEEIYDTLVSNGTIPASLRDIVYRREVELEIAESIPIQANLDRVQDGDLLISDMYLPASNILQMVRSVGLTRQVTIYQSNGDKSNGSIWPRLASNKPYVHLGDNAHSDYNMPKRAGLSAELCTNSSLTATEHELINSNLPNLGLLVREIRLAYNGGFESHFSVATENNLPLLFVLAELVYRRCASRNIVFLGRDCQLLHKIYNAYYGVAPYLPFSRAVAFKQPELAMLYLRTHAPKNPVYIDISSTGGTWERLDTSLNVCVAIYSDTAYYTPNKPVLPENFSSLTTNSQIGQTNLLIEMFNCGDHGHLESLTQVDGNIMLANFAEPELPAPLIEALHTPAHSAVKLAHIYKDAIRAELGAYTDSQLIEQFSKFAMRICNRTDLLEHAKRFLDKETTYLEQFTSEQNT